MAFASSLKATLSGETHEEIGEDMEYYLKRNPRFCHCCGKRLTAEDVWGSQGWHCIECWDHLAFDEEGFWCTLHDTEHRFIQVWPLFDPLLRLYNMEDFGPFKEAKQL